jgi:pyridoxamine 5'-phosphate oxidase
VDLSQEIIDRFNQTMHAARVAGEPEPTAMVLGTSDAHGLVSSRTVLLKALDCSGFVFFTNTESKKGRQLAANPRAAATFLWKFIESQVQLVGSVQLVTDEEADAYFATRDRGSQIGAWASMQSRPLDSREALEQRARDLEAKYKDKVIPRPPFWSGYRLQPDTVEFWKGRPFRLHDRFLYFQKDGEWIMQRLYP